MDITFKVNPAASVKGSFFALLNDNWDDYQYKTSFNLHFYDYQGNKKYIGVIKILHEDEKETLNVIPSEFNELSNQFCSLGQDMSFYENLKSEFPENFLKILEKLNDIAFFEGIKDAFENHAGFKSSLRRHMAAEIAFNEAEKTLLNISFEQDFRFRYNCLLDNANDKHSIFFNFEEYDELPFRIITLVGKNGTGKTQLLANLALDLSGLSRKKLKDDIFIPSRPPFSKVIAISYSIFDKFTRPVPSKSFSYKYCGLKDENGRLLSGNKIVENYKNAIESIVVKRRQKSWDTTVSNILGQELTDIFYVELFENSNFEIVNYIKNNILSSGQSFLMYVITEVIANIKPKSLLLFDEPEMHLHPNAISNLIRMLDTLLNKYDSYAIVATHSPIILQEIPSKYVKVLDRQGNSPMIYDLPLESFGENIEVLTQEVFKTKDVENNYKVVLEQLSRDYQYENILEFFNNLSLNAKAYLLGKYNN